jgi:hypothetical protein
MSEHVSQQRLVIDDFLRLIQPWEPAYGDAVFSFVAVRKGNELKLAQGHLILPTGRILPPVFDVDTLSICAGSFRLSQLQLDSRTLIEHLIGGGIPTSMGNLAFFYADEVERSFSASIERYPQNFDDTNAHAVTLSIGFSQFAFTNDAARFRNDLRSCSRPYDSPSDLASELGLRAMRWDLCTLDVSANNVVAVNLDRSIINGQAKLGLLAAHGIDLAPARLAYRVLSGGKVVERRALSSEELSWESTEAYRSGDATVNVPAGALVQCFASYDGLALHHGWVVQPGSFTNVRRVIHELFDTDFLNTRKYLFDEKYLRQEAKDFEIGIANLLYMLGFSVDPLFGKPMSRNPDLIASTPAGNVFVIECTTGAIDNDGKLSKLLTRTAQLQQKFQQTGHAHVRCLPVVATSLSRNSITDVQMAEAHGVVVVTSVDIENYLNRTVAFNDPDVYFREKWQALHAGAFDQPIN